MKYLLLIALVTVPVILAGRHEDIIYGNADHTEEDLKSLYDTFVNEYKDIVLAKVYE